jgi:hypothetical protein
MGDSMLDWLRAFQDTIGTDRALLSALALIAALALLACLDSSGGKRPKDWED